MEERKTLKYHSIYLDKDVEVSLRIDSYCSNNSLYIGLEYIEDGNWMPWGDMTINLPFSILDADCAYLDATFDKEYVKMIEEYQLGNVISQSRCNMGIYKLVKFDLNKLAEYDPEGMERYMTPDSCNLLQS